MDGKKSSRTLEKTQVDADAGQKWDWEVEGEQEGKLDAIVEEEDNDEPLVSL